MRPLMSAATSTFICGWTCPLAVTDGPAAGQSISYFRAPFGTYIELISYPKGMAYEETAETPLWDPRDNKH